MNRPNGRVLRELADGPQERKFRSVDAALAFLAKWGPRLQSPRSTGFTSLEDLEMRQIDGGPAPIAQDALVMVADVMKCIDPGSKELGALTDEERLVLGLTFGLQIGQRREKRGGEAVYIDEAEDLVMPGANAAGKTRAYDSSTDGKHRATRDAKRRARGELSYAEVARHMGWFTGREDVVVPNHVRVSRTLSRARAKVRAAMVERGMLEVRRD